METSSAADGGQPDASVFANDRDGGVAAAAAGTDATGSPDTRVTPPGLDAGATSEASALDGGTDSEAAVAATLRGDGSIIEDGAPRDGAGSAIDAASGMDGATPGDAGANGAGAECSIDGRHPSELAQTGLYATWSPDPAQRALDPRLIAYAPGLTLWSDGAQKRRFLRLPPGARVVTDDMDGWVFPPGTKIWKEFSVPVGDAGAYQLAETRFLCKQANGTWFRMAYEWSLDGATASERPTGDTRWPSAAPASTRPGAPSIAPTAYEVPSQRSCDKCHGGAVDGVLGFEAISLANGGQFLEADGGTMTLAEFAAAAPDVFTVGPDPAALAIPGDPVASEALGWLHANCGTSCHNATGVNPLAANFTHMRLTVGTLASVESTDTYTTAVGIVSTYQPPGASGDALIAAGDPDDSVVFLRTAVRGTTEQMPPISTHVVPADAVSTLRVWIAGLRPTTDP